jgi:hypothetical protein
VEILDFKERNNQSPEIIIELVLQVGEIKEHLIYLQLIMELLLGNKYLFLF